MNRVMIVARLARGRNADAERLIANGPPFDPQAVGLHSHSVFLTATEVIFLFEAPEVEWIVDDLVNDPVISAAFSAWQPLLDGPPRLAHERHAWQRPSLDAASGAGV